MTLLSAEDKVRLGARAALEKKAEDVMIMNLQGISQVADFFLVASAQSATQIKSIVDAIDQALKSHGVRRLHSEGVPESGWLLHCKEQFGLVAPGTAPKENPCPAEKIAAIKQAFRRFGIL